MRAVREERRGQSAGGRVSEEAWAGLGLGKELGASKGEVDGEVRVSDEFI